MPRPSHSFHLVASPVSWPAPSPAVRRTWLGLTTLVALVGGGCTVQPLGNPEPDTTAYETRTVEVNVSRKLDLLFLIDDSPSMEMLQKTMTANFPAFIEALRDEKSGQLPDLHVGVVSSDLGAGTASATFAVKTQCGRVGGDAGFLQSTPRLPSCRAPDDPFIIDSIDANGQRIGNHGNVSVADSFTCIASLGQGGCGFESQFGATLAALDPARNPGFLRDDAYLAVVMLTNEDDCTLGDDPSLFEPRLRSPGVSDPAARNFWCPQFGLKCDQPLPSEAPATPITLTHCHSAEDGALMNVSTFVAGVRRAKLDPNRIFLAAITSPTLDDKGDVLPVQVTQRSAGKEIIPELVHQCEASVSDAAIRIHEAVAQFGARGLFSSTICQNDYTAPLAAIGRAISANFRPTCTSQVIAHDGAGQPHCLVQDHLASAKGPATTIPFCDDIEHPRALPCWHLDATDCPAGGTTLKIERDAGVVRPATVTTASCEICAPGSTSSGCF